MSKPVVIRTDAERSSFLLAGDIEQAIANTRLIFGLKRLNYSLLDGEIAIPFQERSKIKTLQEVQAIFEKFSYDVHFAEETRLEVSSFDREQKTFNHFTAKAKTIRNDLFRDNPELVNLFDGFQSLLQKSLVRPLYPLQLLSAFHMAFSQNSCNFAVPGAGKTSIVYGAYAYLKSLPPDDPKHVDKLIVIGPLSSFAPWESEYAACFGSGPSVRRLSGDLTLSRSKREQHLFSGNPAEITLIFHGGVDALQEEIVSFLRRHKTMVVVDEAHRIKNPEGVWGKSAVAIAKEARSRIILTGTPVPNGYEDLYNLFQYLYPYKYKDILKFHYGNLREMTETSSPESDRVREFIDNISPYFIRIKKKDLHLPPAYDHLVEISMDSRQREIYDFIETKYLRAFSSNRSATAKDILNKAKLIRLRQAATNPSLLLKPIADTLAREDYDSRMYFGGSMPDEFQDDSEIISQIARYGKLQTPAKFVATRRLLVEELLKNNGKAIIWTIFIQNAKSLQSYLSEAGIKAELLIGEVVQEERERVVAEFNDPANSDFSVVIANPFAVSESISLHKGCHNAIYLERDYNCSNFLQSKDRIHRYGLPADQPTNYYYLISKDSVDGVIHTKLSEKVARMEKIIDDDIPLFARVHDSDESDLITALMNAYAKRA